VDAKLWPHFEPSGWVQWPERDELSSEFAKLLGAAQENASTVSECFLAASRIDPSDPQSWCREWSSLGDANRRRATDALESGHTLTAHGNLLRAINYYQAATVLFEQDEIASSDGFAVLQRCVRDYLGGLTPAGAVVEIPWIGGYPLQGYLLPASSAAKRSPAVIHIGEPGDRKEAYFYKAIRYARDRGFSLLVVDLMGWDAGARFDGVVGRPDLETAIGCCVDYLEGRDEIDQNRIAVLGDRPGSSFVARGVAEDHRVAAAVCDGGLWDLRERAMLGGQPHMAEYRNIFEGEGVGARIKCPVLITIGEHDWLPVEAAAGLVEQLKALNRDVTVRVFRAAETAASHGHLDNPTLVSEFVFDWLADRISRPKSSRGDRISSDIQRDPHRGFLKAAVE
jgi:pimeloyl-ACP methyl ester carboxylesterase